MNFRVKTASMAAALVMVIGAGGYFAYGKIDKKSNTRKVDATAKTRNIGDRGPGGGWIFYDKGSYSGGWRYLEAAPVDQGTAKWGCYNTYISGASGTAIGTGKSNTQAIINVCTESGTVEKLCTNYRGGGKSDWFLPSKEELNLMYKNLKQKGVGGFAAGYYWSSSNFNAVSAYYQVFTTGVLLYCTKNSMCRVRAIRAL